MKPLVVKAFFNARAVAWLTLGACCLAPTALHAADETPRGNAVVVTNANVRHEGPLAREGDVLQVGDKRLDVGDVEHIELHSSAQLALAWLGQGTRDVTKPGAAAGANGVPDMQLRLSGLPTGDALKQIVAVARFPTRASVWRLDTSNSPHWKIELEQASGSSSADLYLEPSAVDAFEQIFELTLTFASGKSVKVTTQALTHTSDKPAGQAATVDHSAKLADALPVAVYLTEEQRLAGALVSLAEESLVVRTSWNADANVPLLQVRGIWFGAAQLMPGRDLFDACLANPAPNDAVVLLGRDDAPAQIAGHVTGFADGKLSMQFEGEQRSINQSRLRGIVFGAHPVARRGAAPYQMLRLLGEDTVNGSFVSVGPNDLVWKTTWNDEWRISRAAIRDVAFRNGNVVNLSDLDPVSVEEIPFFGRKFPLRRGTSLSGGPMVIRGATYTTGVAMHSRCVAVYAIDGRYDTFEATIGFEDEVKGRGDVGLSILGDGREIFRQDKLTGKDDPLRLSAPVSGVKELTLIVGFGDGEDAGDRVLWANAKLMRKGSQP